jgi:ABC-type glycerol-3-phosphate transport system substrate-binding protein
MIAAATLLLATPAMAAQNLTVWTRISQEGAKPFFDEFQKRNPDIELQVEYIPGGKNHVNKLVAAVAAGTPPDVTTLDVIATEGFGRLDALLPLDDLVKSNPNLAEKLFPQGPLGTGRYEGKLYALPFGGDGSLIVYNKAIFKERGLDPSRPPRTWDEFTEAARKLTFSRGGGAKPDVYGFYFIPSQPSLTTFLWLPYFWMAGGTFNDREKMVFTFDSPAGERALGYLMDLHLKHKVVPPSAIGAAGTADNMVEFLQGRVAMAFAGPTVIGRVARDAPTMEIGLMPHPTPTADTRSTTFSGGDNVAIMKGIPKDKLPAAIKLMEWLVSVEGQRLWQQTKFFLPVRVELLQDSYYATRPLEKAALEIFLTAHEPPVTAHYVEVQQYLRDAFEETAFGLATPKEALAKAAGRANELVKRTGKP